MDYCEQCKHFRKNWGEPNCSQRPYDYSTLIQREIVRWLKGSMISQCPGFEERQPWFLTKSTD
jgi:hypothetical protein